MMTFQNKILETHGKRTKFGLTGGHVVVGRVMDFGEDFVVVGDPADECPAEGATAYRGTVVRDEDIVYLEVDRSE